MTYISLICLFQHFAENCKWLRWNLETSKSLLEFEINFPCVGNVWLHICWWGLKRLEDCAVIIEVRAIIHVRISEGAPCSSPLTVCLSPLSHEWEPDTDIYCKETLRAKLTNTRTNCGFTVVSLTLIYNLFNEKQNISSQGWLIYLEKTF